MRYVEARLTEKTHALMYRIYVSNALQSIANEISVCFTKNGKEIIKKSYYEFYQELKEPEIKETRTSEEVISHMKSKMAKLRNGS